MNQTLLAVKLKFLCLQDCFNGRLRKPRDLLKFETKTQVSTVLQCASRFPPMTEHYSEVHMYIACFPEVSSYKTQLWATFLFPHTNSHNFKVAYCCMWVVFQKVLHISQNFESHSSFPIQTLIISKFSLFIFSTFENFASYVCYLFDGSCSV